MNQPLETYRLLAQTRFETFIQQISDLIGSELRAEYEAFDARVDELRKKLMAKHVNEEKIGELTSELKSGILADPPTAAAFADLSPVEQEAYIESLGPRVKNDSKVDPKRNATARSARPKRNHR